MIKIYHQLWFDNYEAVIDDPLIFPNKATKEQLQNIPKAIVLTTEFDSLKNSSHEAADLYKANGKLLEYGKMKGCAYGHHYHYDFETSDLYYSAIARAMKAYL